jgi:four helix bundle protein
MKLQLTTYCSLLIFMYHDFHKLTVYSKAKQLTKKVIQNLSPLLTKNQATNSILNQLVRSSSSIGANIAEGYGRSNKKEYKQFLGIARGSSLETQYRLEIIQESYNLNISDIMDLNTEIIKLLTTTIKNLSSEL